jgi:hypothetical protein
MSVTDRPSRTPWGWIAACAVLALVAAGLLIWALELRGDLDAQRAATRRAQQQARTANDRVDSLSSQLDKAEQVVAQVRRALAAVSARIGDSLGGVLDDLKRTLPGLSP